MIYFLVYNESLYFSVLCSQCPTVQRDGPLETEGSPTHYYSHYYSPADHYSGRQQSIYSQAGSHNLEKQEAGVKRRPVQIGDLYQCGDLYQLATDQYGDLYQFGDWTGLVALTQDTDTEGGVSVTVMSNKEQKKGENI